MVFTLQCVNVVYHTIDLWIVQKYTNNERSEREIKETLPFTITSMKI